MNGLYIALKILCAPGTFVKAFFEHIACRLFGAGIVRTGKYISHSEFSGHMEHLPVKKPSKCFMLSFLPSILTFLVGLPFILLGILTLGYLGVDIFDPVSGSFCPMFIVYCVLYFVGITFLYNLFPHVSEAKTLWKTFYGKESTVSVVGKICAFLPTCILVGGAYLEKYGITFLLSFLSLAYFILA